MTAFFRFPHTPHLAWLGSGRPRNDKVLSPEETRAMLSHELVVEEKIDGANLGFSVSADGTLRAQNRGTYLNLEAPTGQWKPLKRWLSVRRETLGRELRPGLMLFGEWCYAVHSIHYSRLPDWFLVFDVYDHARGEFWDVHRRNEFAAVLGLAIVPERARGRLTIGSLTRLLDSSVLADGPAEGIYVRREDLGRVVARAKLVRPEFVQAINVHWSKHHLETNRLATSADGARS